MLSSLANALVAKPLGQSRGWVCQRCSPQAKVRWQSSTPGRSAIKIKPSTQRKFTIKKMPSRHTRSTINNRLFTQRRSTINKRLFTQRRLLIKNKTSTQRTSAIENKPYYITSPIFYVNAGKASQAQTRDSKSTDISCSTSYRSPLHPRLDGHSEEVARFVRQKIYTRHRDRRAWNESVLRGLFVVNGAMAHVVTRSNGQLQRQGKKCERFATRPISRFRSVCFGSVL